MAETTGLCGGRINISDLDSIDQRTGFPTKWMSDLSGYDSQATVSDNEDNYTDSSETGNVRAINIQEVPKILCERLSAEENEKKYWKRQLHYAMN